MIFSRDWDFFQQLSAQDPNPLKKSRFFPGVEIVSAAPTEGYAPSKFEQNQNQGLGRD